MAEDIDPVIFGIFLEEYAEILESLDGVLARWLADPADDKALAEIQRLIHTLKGAARMAGVDSLGDYCHGLETAVQHHREDGGDNDSLRRLLEAAMGPLTDNRGRLEQGGAGASLFLPEASDPADGEPAPAAMDLAVPTAEATNDKPAPEPTAEPVALPQESAAPTAAAPPRPGGTIRVEAQRLDDLIGQAMQLSGAGSAAAAATGQLEASAAELQSAHTRLSELQRRLASEAAMLAHLEDDDSGAAAAGRLGSQSAAGLLGDIARDWREVTDDLALVREHLGKASREFGETLTRLSRDQSVLRDGLLATRTVALSWLEPRLQRLLRQTAGELGKSAELVFDTPDGEVDRQLLERITGALEHLLRNALDHGLETPEVRQRQGKSPQGEIHIALASDGSRLRLSLRDDGAGIDTDALQVKARQAGLLGATDVLSGDEALRLIFHPGLSTAAKVSQVSGRGVGMDAVLADIEALGGSVAVSSELGKGTEFTLSLPFTLSMMELLIVGYSGRQLALPAVRVEELLPLDAAIATALGTNYPPALPHKGQDWLLGDPADFFGVSAAGEATDPHLVLLRAGDRRLALPVHEVGGTRALPVRPVPGVLAQVPGLLGLSVLGESLPLLVMDPASLQTGSGAPGQDAAAPRVMETTRILCVDDSLSARRRLHGDLQQAGWRAECLGSARECMDWFATGRGRPDLLIIDAGMPGMDGFQLLQRLRSSGLYKGPVVFTGNSRHRRYTDKARTLGARRFLLKPCRPETLRQCCEQILAAEESS